MVKGWEIIDQFIEEMKQDDIAYFIKLKQLKKEIGYNAWVKKVADGEITKTDSAIIRNSDEYIKDLVEKDAEARKIKIQKQVAEKVGNILECDLQRNENGGFDGKIRGDKGQIYIETIVAGGYNIQRAHYRTLIKEG